MSKQKINDVINESRQILRRYKLCDNCLGRMFASRLNLTSHKTLGIKIRHIAKLPTTSSCYICKKLMLSLDDSLNKLLEKSGNYEFSTFLIGAILQPSVLDHDDVVRSTFHLHGIVGIKSDITRELGKRFGRRTRSKVDYLNPDIAITVDFKKDEFEIKPKAVILQGRYVKEKRGLPQKQKPCDRCNGKGCFACDFHGLSNYESVEGKISKFLFDRFGAQQAKFTWIGSEDESSTVVGNGRPFFVKLISPHKRNTRLPTRINLDGVSVLKPHLVSKIPTAHIKFRTIVNVVFETTQSLSDKQIMEISDLRDVLTHVDGSTLTKFIYSMNITMINSNLYEILLDIDGGIPIKKFVTGMGVEPSLSSLLQNQCQCQTFDFQKISLIK